MHLHNSCSGRFTISTDKRGVIAEFDNLITNDGLDRMANNNDYLVFCQVGSGSATPNVLDSALANRIAGTNVAQGSVISAQSSSPYYTSNTKTYRFNAGVATGNISEVGIGWSTVGDLFSRALILDGGGQPTTITILSDEILDVTYQLRFYPKVTDETGTLVTTGSAGASYSFIGRAANVTSSSNATGWQIGGNGVRMSDTVQPQVFDGPIGSITAAPSGNVVSITSTQFLPIGNYTAGSYSLLFRFTLGLNDANLAGGIRSIRCRLGIGTFQFQFTPAIIKTSDQVITLDFTSSWGRVV
jgi:hypothetical protein